MLKSIHQEDASQTLDSLMEGMCEGFDSAQVARTDILLPERSDVLLARGPIPIWPGQSNANFPVCDNFWSMP